VDISTRFVGDTLQISVKTMHPLRTPAVLCAWTVFGYVVRGVLATFTLHLASFIVYVFTCCVFALLVSWLLLHYGNGSDDVISVIDNIADFLFPPVSHDTALRILRLCSGHY